MSVVEEVIQHVSQVPTAEQVREVWKKKFEEGILCGRHFKDYWSAYVPEVLLPPQLDEGFNYEYDETILQSILISPLEEFICDANPAETFARLKERNTPPVCGRVFKMSEPTYNCKECCTDPTCVLCVDCFQQSVHRNHKYRMSTSNGGGCCDCGDVEAWKNDPHCNFHIRGVNCSTNQPELPGNLGTRAHLTLHSVLRYCFEVITLDHTADIPSDLRLIRGNDPLDLLEDPDKYCTVLYNDESHTFENVISTLGKVVKCSQRDAMDLVTSIDREGRAVVKSSTFQQCEELKTEIERITSRSASKPLKVVITHAYVVAHQLFAMTLLEWVQKILGYSSKLREIFSEIVLQPDYPNKQCIVEGILQKDSFLWKSARVHWHRLFICGAIMEYENKKAFAVMFTMNYPSVMKDFVRDDHDHGYSISSLSVQLYTVPSIAHYLIAEHDILFVLLNTFLSECSANVRSGQLEFQRNENNLMFKRAQFVMYDLQYLLSVPPSPSSPEWNQRLKKGFLNGLSMMLKLMGYMQGMDAVTRQVGTHIEYEAEWETAFNIVIKFTSVIASMFRWARIDRNTLMRAYRITLKALFENPFSSLSAPIRTVEIVGHGAICVSYDVTTLPVSIHIPLSRFLAGLHLSLYDLDLRFHGPEFQVPYKLTPQLLIEPVLRAQVMIAQVHAGMWRRNGYSILHQIYFYHNVKCRTEMFDKDIVLLQIGASLIDGNQFLIHMLDKFNLENWASPDYEENLRTKPEEESVRTVTTIVEEFLKLLIMITGERYTMGISEVTESDCIKKEIIQYLCVKPHSHSELNKALSESYGFQPVTSDIIMEVASFEKSQQSGRKGVYKLKDEYYEMFDVFYYHYTREECSKAEEAQRIRKRRNGELECCPPPPLPELKKPFWPIANLLRCDMMLHIMYLVLSRGVDLRSQSFSEAQLHRVLHLLGYALHEEDSGRYDFMQITTITPIDKIKSLLDQLLVSPRVESSRDLIRWILDKFIHTHARTLYRIVERRAKGERIELGEIKMVDYGTQIEDDFDKEREKERRTRLANERRAAIMAQMHSLQKSFLQNNTSLFEEALPDLGKVKKGEEEEVVVTSDEVIQSPVALGVKRTHPQDENNSYVCILCQYEETLELDKAAFVYLAYIQKSMVLVNPDPRGRFSDPPSDEATEKERKSVECYFMPSRLGPAPFASTCGHVMHVTCFKKFFNSIVAKESRRPYRLRHPASFNIEKQEFLCPLCESLCNGVFPCLPPLHTLYRPLSNFEDHVSFEGWINSLKGVAEKKIGHYKRSLEKQDDETKKTDSSSTIPTLAEEFVNAVIAATQAEQPSTSSTNTVVLTSASDEAPESTSLQGTVVPLEMPLENENMQLHVVLCNGMDHHNTSLEEGFRLSGDVKDTVGLYAQATWLKGQRLADGDDEKKVLTCWKSCAYVIHTLERLLRQDASKSLLGNFTSRQTISLKSVVRVSALQQWHQGDRLINGYARVFLSILFGDGTVVPNISLLEWDVFGMLVSLTMSLYSVFYMDISPPLPIGTVIDSFILRLMVTATVAQIFITVEFNEEILNTTNPVNDESLKCLHKIHGMFYSYPINSVPLWKCLKEYLRPFLRCCTIFYHFLTGVPAPTYLTEAGGDTFENMCRYLDIPTSCEELLGRPIVMSLLEDWAGVWKKHSSDLFGKPVKVHYYLPMRKLIELPTDYSEIINSVSNFVCPNSDEEDSRNPTLCLVCGRMLCSQSYCCQEELDGTLVGACTYHSITCSAGAGIFLRIRECELMLLSVPNRGCFLPPPYVDEYGETDQRLKRGNALFLSNEIYAEYQEMWLSHGIHEKVARTIELSPNASITQWQHF